MDSIDDVTFDMQIINGQAVVTRSLRFSNDDTISFKVTLPQGFNGTISEVHLASAQMAIDRLQDWLKP